MPPGVKALVVFAVATAPVAPFVRLCLHPRFIRAFPRIGVSFGTFILAYLLGLTVVAVWLPALLAWIAAGAGSVAVWLLWRARPRYGADRRLPPGSLTLLPVQHWTNRRHFANLAAVHGPVFKTSHFFHPMVCIMSLESGLRLLKEFDDVRLRSPKTAPDRFLPCGFLRGMEPENHAIYRKLTQSLMTPEALAGWQPSIADDANAALAALAAEPGGVYAKPVWDDLLFTSFSRLFFGVHPGTDEFRTLQAGCRIASRASERKISIPWLPSERRIETALQDLCRLLQHHDGGGSFLGEIQRQHSQLAGDPQLLRLLVFMLLLAASDMAGLLQWVAKTLCESPETVAALRAELEAGIEQSGPDSLASRVLLETLRSHQVEHLYRRALADIEWDGFLIPKGWLVRICLAEAHRDASVFPNPDRFDPSRFAAAPTQQQFLPFGAFRRSCIGESVARTFVQEFLCTWTRNWDCHQIGQSREDIRAWHWTPGADFRFAIRERSSSNGRAVQFSRARLSH